MKIIFKYLLAIVFSSVCVFSSPEPVTVSLRETSNRYDVIRNFCEIKPTDPVDVDILNCLSYSKLIMEDGFITTLYTVEYKNTESNMVRFLEDIQQFNDENGMNSAFFFDEIIEMIG